MQAKNATQVIAVTYIMMLIFGEEINLQFKKNRFFGHFWMKKQK